MVEVMTDLPVPHPTIVMGFDECVDVLLVGRITGGIVLWIQMVEPYGNLETKVVGILVIGKVKTVLTYSTVVARSGRVISDGMPGIAPSIRKVCR